jgi:hypothetical protein
MISQQQQYLELQHGMDVALDEADDGLGEGRRAQSCVASGAA